MSDAHRTPDAQTIGAPVTIHGHVVEVDDNGDRRIEFHALGGRFHMWFAPEQLQRAASGAWRVGRRNGHAIYLGDEPAAFATTTAIAAQLVAAANGEQRTDSAQTDDADPKCPAEIWITVDDNGFAWNFGTTRAQVAELSSKDDLVVGPYVLAPRSETPEHTCRPDGDSLDEYLACCGCQEARARQGRESPPLATIFELIGNACACVELLASDESGRNAARECLRRVSAIRDEALRTAKATNGGTK